MNTLISIIVPVYKVEKYLDECVQSLVDQTYKNLEIILVDDGSPDRCPQMCDDWARKDSRIRVIHKPNGGLSSARNAGLDAAKGDYIGFVDSDDIIDTEMYEKLYEPFENFPNVGITSCMIFRYVDGCITPYNKSWDVRKPRLLAYKDFAIELLPCQRNFVICCKLFKKELVQDVRFEVGKRNEDSLFIFALSQNVKNSKWDMLEVPFYGYYYRFRSDSICAAADNPLVPVVIENFKGMEMKSREFDEDLANRLKQFWEKTLLFYYSSLVENSQSLDNLAKYKEDVQEISLSAILRNTLLSLKSRLAFLVLARNEKMYYYLIHMSRKFLS